MATDMSIGKSAVISAMVAAVGLFVLVWLVKDAKRNDGLSDDYFVIERASGFVINDLDGVNYDDIQKAFDTIDKYKEDNKFDFGDTTLYDSLGVRFVDDAKKDMDVVHIKNTDLIELCGIIGYDNNSKEEQGARLCIDEFEFYGIDVSIADMGQYVGKKCRVKVAKQMCYGNQFTDNDMNKSGKLLNIKVEED